MLKTRKNQDSTTQLEGGGSHEPLNHRGAPQHRRSTGPWSINRSKNEMIRKNQILVFYFLFSVALLSTSTHVVPTQAGI